MQENPLKDLPRYLSGSLVILNNPRIYTFNVDVHATNEPPTIENPLVELPPISFNLSSTSNTGIMIKDLLHDARASDIDNVFLGIAIVKALNTSVGLWEYRSPFGVWTPVIVNNTDYSDHKEKTFPVMLLNSSYWLKFQIHSNDILWSKSEARTLARIIFLPWDGSDNSKIGKGFVTRPSNKISAYGRQSVSVTAVRKGCDNIVGSKSRYDRCGVCGGNGMSCVACDGVVFSNATIGK